MRAWSILNSTKQKIIIQIYCFAVFVHVTHVSISPDKYNGANWNLVSGRIESKFSRTAIRNILNTYLFTLNAYPIGISYVRLRVNFHLFIVFELWANLEFGRHSAIWAIFQTTHTTRMDFVHTAWYLICSTQRINHFGIHCSMWPKLKRVRQISVFANRTQRALNASRPKSTGEGVLNWLVISLWTN